jgi:hypothetical protein
MVQPDGAAFDPADEVRDRLGGVEGERCQEDTDNECGEEFHTQRIQMPFPVPPFGVVLG